MVRPYSSKFGVNILELVGLIRNCSKLVIFDIDNFFASHRSFLDAKFFHVLAILSSGFFETFPSVPSVCVMTFIVWLMYSILFSTSFLICLVFIVFIDTFLTFSAQILGHRELFFALSLTEKINVKEHNLCILLSWISMSLHSYLLDWSVLSHRNSFHSSKSRLWLASNRTWETFMLPSLFHDGSSKETCTHEMAATWPSWNNW